MTFYIDEESLEAIVVSLLDTKSYWFQNKRPVNWQNLIVYFLMINTYFTHSIKFSLLGYIRHNFDMIVYFGIIIVPHISNGTIWLNQHSICHFDIDSRSILQGQYDYLE